MRVRLIAAGALILLAVVLTALAPERCADYPDGRRCDTTFYALVVVAGLAAALGVALAVHGVVVARRRRSRGG